MHDHGLPIAVRLRRSPGTIRKIGEGIRPLEHRARFRSTLPLAAVTRNATTLVDLLPVSHIRTLGIAQRLRGKKQMPAKKHDKAHCHYARRSLQNCRRKFAHPRFENGIRPPPSFSAAILSPTASRPSPHSHFSLFSASIKLCIRPDPALQAPAFASAFPRVGEIAFDHIV